jgi:hypothetical protein
LKFETARLSCRSLSIEEYEEFESGQEPDWGMEKFSNPHQHLIVGPNPLTHRIPRVKTDTNFADIGLVLAFEISSGMRFSRIQM